MTEKQGCDYCERGKLILHRGSKQVRVTRIMQEKPFYALEMRWKTANGKWRMELEKIAACPMCGRSLR